MRYQIILGLAALIVALDQFTKWIVLSTMSLTDEIALTGFFSLVHVRNRGAAFGFLSDPDITWQFWLFLAATLVAVAAILWIAKGAEAKEKLLFIALGCIMGGALGNLIDRIRFRAVVDFLDFHAAGWHWPAFNVADIAICLGAALTALLAFRPLPPASSSKEKR